MTPGTNAWNVISAWRSAPGAEVDAPGALGAQSGFCHAAKCPVSVPRDWLKTTRLAEGGHRFRITPLISLARWHFFI
jgi:hypothetical protein